MSALVLFGLALCVVNFGPTNANFVDAASSTNDLILGSPTSQTVLLYSERVVERVQNSYRFEWFGYQTISRIEALDQSNGTGGFVSSVVGGIYVDFVHIDFWTSNAPQSPIDFVVNIYGKSTHWVDIIEGVMNNRSNLLLSQRVRNESFSWESSSKITRFEIRDQTNVGNNSGHILSMSGGISQRFLQFNICDKIPDKPVDYLVNIFTEPQDYLIGFDSPYASLVHTERVRSNRSFAHFQWSSAGLITKIVALDQTNGTGGEVTFVEGINLFRLFMEFFSHAPQSRIDFIVLVYSETDMPNDLIVGNLTENSVLVLTQELTDATVDHNFWTYTSPHPITLMELFDRTNGTGSRVDFHSVGTYDITLWFQHAGILNFTVNVYGEPFVKDSSNDIILGELTALSWRLESKLVQEWRWTVATYVFESEHTLTRIEIVDQLNGAGGRPQVIHGGIGNHTLVVLFTSEGRRIDSLVTVYAG